jgi:hypothetical protein
MVKEPESLRPGRAQELSMGGRGKENISFSSGGHHRIVLPVKAIRGGMKLELLGARVPG